MREPLTSHIDIGALGRFGRVEDQLIELCGRHLTSPNVLLTPAVREKVFADSGLPFRDFVAGEVLEDAHEAGMVPALAAERGGGVEQFLRRRGVG